MEITLGKMSKGKPDAANHEHAHSQVPPEYCRIHTKYTVVKLIAFCCAVAQQRTIGVHSCLVKYQTHGLLYCVKGYPRTHYHMPANPSRHGLKYILNFVSMRGRATKCIFKCFPLARPRNRVRNHPLWYQAFNTTGRRFLVLRGRAAKGSVLRHW